MRVIFTLFNHINERNKKSIIKQREVHYKLTSVKWEVILFNIKM